MPLNIRIIAFVTMLVACVAASAQKTTRPNLKRIESHQVAVYDTIYPAKGDFVVSGYEKAQMSSSESLFVTNNTLHDITAINMTIKYYDRHGQLLNTQEHTASTSMEPFETRSFNLSTWDRQHLWYYVKSQARHNEYCTPFDVKIHINYAVYLRTIDL